MSVGRIARHNKLPRGLVHVDDCDGRRSAGAENRGGFYPLEAGELKPPIVCLRSISQKHW
jgi:hypothetical protein